MTVAPRSADRRWRMAATLPPAAALLAAVAMAAVSFAPFAPAKAYMDSLTSDGNAETFTPELFASFILIARLAAVTLVAGAAALFRYRVAIAGTVRSRASGIGLLAGDLWRDGARAIRAERPAHLGVLTAIVLFGVAIRAVALGQPINYDESFTYITYASRPWLVAWADYSYPNNHLFHTLLAHAALQVFGLHLWALRLPAFVAGCLAIPLSYIVGRRLVEPDAGLITAALVATTQALIAFSVCARGYTLLLAIVLLMILCADDLITTGSPRAWPVMAVLAALGFFTVPVFIYPWGAVLGWVLLARGDRGARGVDAVLRCGAATFGLVALLYAPALATSGLASAFDYATGAGAGTFVRQLAPSLAGVASDLMRGMPAVMIGMLAVAFIAGAVAVRGERVMRLLAALLMWSAVAVLAQRVVAPPRAWLFALPILFVIVAAGVVKAFARAGGFTVAVLVTVALCTQAAWHRPVLYTEVNGPEEVYGNTDLEPVARYLEQALEPQDAVVAAIPLDYPLEFYLRVHDRPAAALRRPPQTPARLLVLTNDALGETLPIVLAKKGYAPALVQSSQLARAFQYSSVYEVRMRR